MTRFTSDPTLTPNPNSKVPLAAVLLIETDGPVEGWISIKNEAFKHRIPVLIDPAHSRELAVVGMRPGVEHQVKLELTGLDSTPLSPIEFLYVPPMLRDNPTETPPFEIRSSQPSRMEPGFMLLSIRRRTVTRALWWTKQQKKFAQQWSQLVALDPSGHVVWTYHHDRRIAGIAQLANGNIFFHQVNFHSFEIDMLGNVVRSWVAANRPAGPVEGAVPIDVQSMHHQPHELPNGNFLAMAANTRVIDNYITSETDPQAPRATMGVVGDKIIEFNPGGEIVWSWDSFDHLDPHRVGYHVLEPYWDTRGFPNHADWTHGNGVNHDPRDDTVIMSLKHQDAVLKVDRTGEIKWILGNHSGWDADKQEKLLTPVGDLNWFWHGHNPRVTAAGTIVMYDNSILKARPYDQSATPFETGYSRAVEYEIDEDKMEVRQVWASTDENSPDKVISWAMGDAHRLPKTDNMFVIDSFCLPEEDPLDARGTVSKADLTWNERIREEWHPSDFSYWGRIREYDRASGLVVFEAAVKDTFGIMGWEVFGGAKTPSLGPRTAASTSD